jgi:photosystem II stability/assembly factor-like uncharacterized protein
MQSFKKIIIFLIVILAVAAAFLAAFSFFNKPSTDAPSASTPGTPSGTGEELQDPDASIFVSKDKGVTWRGVSGTKGIAPMSIRFGKTASELFVGTAAKALWKGVDEGKSFAEITDSAAVLPVDARIDDVAVLSNVTKHAYVAASYASKGHVLELAGSEFRELYFTPTTKIAVSGVAVDPADTDHVFIVVQDGLFLESLDGGESWKPLYRFTSRTPTHILMHPQKPGVFWVTMGKGGGVFRTVNGGKDWKSLDTELRKFSGARNPEQIYFDTASGSLYLTSKYGLLRSRDDGTTWTAIKLPVPSAALPVVAIAVNPKNARELYISASGQLYRSIDGGESWSGKDFGTKRKITTITINPVNPREIFIGFDK